MNVITRSKNYALYSNKANSHVRMYVTQGEYATTLATFTLYNGDTVFNLTGISASSILCSVYLTNSINHAVTLPVTVTDAAAGKITVATTQELSATYDGEGFDCYVQVVSTQNAVTKFSGMKIYVQADPTLDLIAQSPNAQTLIDALNKLALIDGGTGTVEVDNALSTSSTNPVQNKKITQKINEMDNYLSSYSFLYDSQGRIYSYTWDTQIKKPVQGVSNGSFGNDIYRASNCYVWLSKNVTSVEEDSLPDTQYILGIRCEGNTTLPEQYSALGNRVHTGRSSLSVFYALATLAYLYNNTLKTGDAYSKADSDSRYRKTSEPITIDNLATALVNLINGKIDSTALNNAISTEAGLRASGDQALSARITAEETARTNAITSLQTVIGGKLSNSNGAVKTSNIDTNAVTEEKLATALANKINGLVTESKLDSALLAKINAKINTANAVKFESNESLDNCTLSDTIYYVYTTDGSGVTGNHVVICANATNQRTQYLFAQEGGIQYRKQIKSSGTWNSWGDWVKLATTAKTTELTEAVAALNTAVESLQQNAIMKTEGAVIENYINNGAVTKNKLAPALKAELDDKLGSTTGVHYVDSQNANSCLAQNTLYVLQTEVDGHIQNTHTLICAEDIDNRAQYRFSVDGGFEYRTQEGLLQEGNPWSEWKAFATDGALSTVATNLSENYYTITQIDNALTTINNAISTLNSTVELKANKATDIDSSTSVATMEETQYPSVGAIKRFVDSHIYRKAEIDAQIGSHISKAEARFGLPVTVGFDNYRVPVSVIDGNTISKNMISGSNIATLFISANVTSISSDILDGSTINTIYIDMDIDDGSTLLENVVGISNIDVYYKDSNYNFNKYLAKALAFIRNQIVSLNSASQRIETKADNATDYVLSVVLPSSSWIAENGRYTQVIDVSSLHTITANTRADMDLDSTAYNQLVSDGCSAIYMETDTVNDVPTLTAVALTNKPTANITVQLTLTEVVRVSSQ